jgi:hypothetical protein
MMKYNYKEVKMNSDINIDAKAAELALEEYESLLSQYNDNVEDMLDSEGYSSAEDIIENYKLIFKKRLMKESF